MTSFNSTEAFDLDLDIVISDLTKGFFECQFRGLVNSCKWLADLIDAVVKHNYPSDKNYQKGQTLLHSSSINVLNSVISRFTPLQLSSYFLARSLLENKEYERCAHVVSALIVPFVGGTQQWSPDINDNLIYFIYVYARLMANEKRKINDQIGLKQAYGVDVEGLTLGQWSQSQYRNSLNSLKHELENYIRYHSQGGAMMSDNLDPYILYVYSLVLRKLHCEEMAVITLCHILSLDHSCWPAWSELAELAKDRDHLKKFKLPYIISASCWAQLFFEAKMNLNLHEREKALEILTRLYNTGFDMSLNLRTDIALAHEGMRDMENAEKHFRKVFELDPFRLEDVDVYSNTLFVREEHAELARLAHHCISVNRYLPQTCCVVGNFHSLRGHHKKAVLYFQRALTLKPSYALVWTLVGKSLRLSLIDFFLFLKLTTSYHFLGHEYMELKNTNAAVHAYNQAVAHNKRDFRAWYGLGQMYEMLNMPSFALYYYRMSVLNFLF
ncbi:unnamed protein product [Protopolystoma xenopodis]|uniref:Cdc23 domain-containing protein n=1 Tax=Protopolystoma xenopodis TaxID=117903 RepID=A0A3S5AGN5_9PLAT|nr:unnamed protein product [Protopolystoma xenopodis]